MFISWNLYLLRTLAPTNRNSELHFFWTVARYEMKILLRSWFFRIFSAFAILFIGIFTFSAFMENDSYRWIFRAIPSAILYADLILVNFGQAVVAVFLSSEFLKQDQKNDSVEVIYVRPMSNAAYVLGKTLGVLMVFGLLNLVIIAFGVGGSFITDKPILDLGVIVAYPLLISLPTLVFIIGLSFFAMVLIKNQAVVFILILGYIAASIYYLNFRMYHVTDYISYSIPMIHSYIVGFTNLYEILLHRGIYFFLGLGFIFFTIYKLNRLPNKDKVFPMPLIFGCLFIFIGAGLIYTFIGSKLSVKEFRKEIVALSTRYPDKNFNIHRCDLDLIHKGNQIEVKADLGLENVGSSALDTLIFSLNPSLKVRKVELGKSEVKFLRDLHLIKVPFSNQLKPNERLELLIEYVGTVDEVVSFVDLNDDEYEDNFRDDLLNLKKNAVFLQSNFVCLTSSSCWYPTAGSGYNVNHPYYRNFDFTQYSLKVKTSPKLTAISQGNQKVLGPGEYLFSPETPLPKISLTIGDYQKKSIIVDSIEYSIYNLTGNDYYVEELKDLKDTVPHLIKDIVANYEVAMGIKYPFKRFSLVEVPVQFNADPHKWSVVGDAAQPQILYYPEKGATFRFADIKSTKYWMERNSRRNNENLLPEEVNVRTFKNIFNNFTEGNNEYGSRYNVFPQYYSFTNQVRSDSFPIFNLALQAYLKERSYGKSRNQSKDYNHQNLRKKTVDELIKIKDENIQSRVINEAIYDKGLFLIKSLQTQFGEKSFDVFLDTFNIKNRFTQVSLTDLERDIKAHFGKPISNQISKWYFSKEMPAYLVKDIKKFKVSQKDGTKYQISFKISNITPTDGFIALKFALDNPSNNNNKEEWDAGKYFIKGTTAFEINKVLQKEPSELKIQTEISENIPNELVFDLKNVASESKDIAIDTVIESTYFSSILKENEIVVDNEDKSFTLSNQSNTGYLKAMVEKNKKIDKYEGIHMWSPPGRWTKVLDPSFSGKFVHSAVYSASGNGERQAIWEAEIKDAGYYNIYFHYSTKHSYYYRRGKVTDYHITVHHDGGTDEIKRYINEFENGWNLLGTYYLSPGKAKVVLSNQSDGRLIIADAVKWTKN